MNARQKTILRKLLSVDHWLPAATLADAVACSERTVRLDANAINHTLEREGLSSRIEGKHGSGIALVAPPEERERIEFLLEAGKEDEHEAVERRARALVELALSPDAHTMESLARALCTNKDKLRSEMRDWEESLAPFRVRIGKGRRLSLEGRERDIRFAVLLLSFVDVPLLVRTRIWCRLLSSRHQAAFDDLVSSVEDQRGFRLSPNSRKQMRALFEIGLRRIKMGRAIDDEESPVGTLPELDAAMRSAKEDLDVRMSDGELSFFGLCLITCMKRWDESISSYRLSARAQNVADALSNACERRFGEPIDAALRRPLAILIEIVQNYRLFPYPPHLLNQNEHVATVVRTECYLALRSLMQGDDRLARERLPESSIARIALLLTEYFDRVLKPPRYRAGLVIDCGLEQAVYCRYRLSRLLPDLEVVEILDESEARRQDAPGRPSCIHDDPPPRPLGVAHADHLRSSLGRCVERGWRPGRRAHHAGHRPPGNASSLLGIRRCARQAPLRQNLRRRAGRAPR